MEKLSPKEIRKNILEFLYEKRAENFVQREELISALSVSEEELHVEVNYLEGKGYVDVGGRVSGLRHLNFGFLKITSYGIDLVEDPDEFNKLFSININQSNFGDVIGSNVSVNSQYLSQIVNKQDDETKELLNQLLEAIDKNDKDKLLKTLGYIGDKSVDLLVAIIAGGMKL